MMDEPILQRMVRIQLVTVEGCKEAPCKGCDEAEGFMRSVVKLAGFSLPDHAIPNLGEHYLADGVAIEAVHLDCDDAEAAGLNPSKAPFILVDGVQVSSGRVRDREKVARAILKALRPNGLAELTT